MQPRARLGMLALAATLLALGSSPARAAAGFTGLGDLAGGAVSSQALGISADGRVVVGESASASGTEAFRFTLEGGLAGLGDFPGGAFLSSARAASADGSIVVGGGVDGPFTSEAFVWTQAGGMQKLAPGADFFTTGVPISAYDVSDDGGKIVGPFFGLTSCLEDGYVWTAATGVAETCAGGPSVGLVEQVSYHAVSGDASTVVGYVLNYDPDFGAHRNWVVIAEGTAYGTNPAGSVVVGGGGYETAFRWTAPGPFPEYLGDPPGGTPSHAWDVSADGAIVIGASDAGGGCGAEPHSPADGDTAGCEAFLWDAGGGMRSLRDELVNVHGLDLAGWTLREARAISDDGNAIVGWGVNPSGDPEGFLAVLETACSNGVDDDGDGTTDLADFGCGGAADLSERTPTVRCDDGLDNDGDGAIDFPADPGCKSALFNIEAPACQNGLDDDSDGKIDFDGGAAANGGIPLGPIDFQCVNPWQPMETAVKHCGLGAELGVALVLLGALRRARRRPRT